MNKTIYTNQFLKNYLKTSEPFSKGNKNTSLQNHFMQVLCVSGEVTTWPDLLEY